MELADAIELPPATKAFPSFQILQHKWIKHVVSSDFAVRLGTILWLEPA
jgi:hypothetical protein